MITSELVCAAAGWVTAFFVAVVRVHRTVRVSHQTSSTPAKKHDWTASVVAPPTGRYRITAYRLDGRQMPDVFPDPNRPGDNPNSDHAINTAWNSLKASDRIGDFYLLDARVRTPRDRHTRRPS